MNKFYTPSFDELHHGIDIEVLRDEEWTANQFVLKDIGFQQNEVRIKYLDVDDITSLGFYFKSKSEGEWLFTKAIQILGSSDYVTLWYQKVSNTPWVALMDSSEDYILAPIMILNKNELKWILNRYGY